MKGTDHSYLQGETPRGWSFQVLDAWIHEGSGTKLKLLFEPKGFLTLGKSGVLIIPWA